METLGIMPSETYNYYLDGFAVLRRLYLNKKATTMFISLLLVTFVLSLVVSALVASLFAKPLQSILQRIIDDPISLAWVRYMKFVILVVGVSAVVRIDDLEKYITPWRTDEKAQTVSLTGERWVLEIYRTIIESLQGIIWLLLVFFVVALIAYVVVRLGELKRSRSSASDD